ncbi:TOMM precursor leader peptide-binding protein [Streptomyces sp. NPDC000410]|uniref:TOMM precursor leader peptide-binding protein n=1 Tax=Streptomyces sp. NPDC000410 TaxID=3154254 RepID=UPI00332975C0
MFLRGAHGDSFLKGKAVYQWLTALAPRLAVGCGIDALCDGLDDRRRDMVVRLVERLHGAGFLTLREPEPAGLLPDEVEQRFGEQISFLAHDGDRPRERFRRWRETRTMVVGSGPAAVSAVRTLLRNGAREVAVAWRGDDAPTGAWDGDLAELTDAGTPARLEKFRLDSADAAVHAVDAWAPDAIVLTPDERNAEESPLRELLFAHAYGTRRVFIAAREAGGYLVKGPLVPAGGRSCWSCAENWLAEHMADTMTVQENGHEYPELYPAVLAAVGSELSLEIFRHIAATGPAGLESAVVVQDPLTLAARRETLPPHPRCPACAPQTDVPDTKASLLALAEGRLDLPADADERYERYRSVLAESTGMLRRFDDASVPQTAVKAGAVRGAGSARGLTYGFHADSLIEARCAAVERAAIRAAATAPAPLATVHRTRKDLADQGESTVTADGLALTRRPDPGREDDGRDEERAIRWTPALSLLDLRTVWVPADLVSGAGNDPAAEHALSGYGAGASFTEVAVGGVLSALLHERIQETLGGRTDPAAELIPLDDAAAGSGLSIVPGLARSGTLTVAALPGPGPAHVVTARHESPDGTLQTVAAGVDRAEAARAALVELAGRIQRRSLTEPEPEPEGTAADRDGTAPDGGPSLLCPPQWPALAPSPGHPSTGHPSTGRPNPGHPGPATAPSPPPPGTAEGADRLARLVAGLRADGRDALLVATPPASLGGTEAPVRVGRVLLTA